MAFAHKEAFCLMTYQSEDLTETEVLWNSRDGVTPFIISSRNGKQMRHINWSLDRCVPDFKPPAGMRIFVNATEDLVRDELAAYVEKIFVDHGGGYWATREEAYAALLPGWLHAGDEPWIVESRG